MCCNSRVTKFGQRHAVYDLKKEKFLELNCKSWACPECSERKKRLMRFGLEKHFADHKGIRMMTVTLSPGKYTPIEHAALLQKAWKYFIKEIRRSRILSETQRKMKYVRCVEFHTGETRPGHSNAATGYIHYHIVIDRFLDVKLLQNLLDSCVKAAGYETDKAKFCNVHLCLIPKLKSAINYVINYITKATAEIGKFLNKWSKSKGTAVFARNTQDGRFIFVKLSNLDPARYLYLLEYSHESPEILNKSYSEHNKDESKYNQLE